MLSRFHGLAICAGMIAAIAVGSLAEPASAAPPAEVIWRTPLKEAGQSGICAQRGNLFLTIHAPIKASSNRGLTKASDVIGQCYDSESGKLKWEVPLPGTNAGVVLESWLDSTSLTPVADDKHVVFHNLNGMLLGCDHAGKVLWKRPFTSPDPDIKNARMFLAGDQVIVALPTGRIAVEASAKHPELPYYHLHAISLATGEDAWVSPVELTHATQYSIDQWEGEPVIVASMIDLSHWKFGQERRGYLISLANGKLIESFEIPSCIPHQKNQLCQGKFVATVGDAEQTRFSLVDPKSGKTTLEIGFETPAAYFAWTGAGYERKPYAATFNHRSLQGRKYPTPSTVHVVGERIFYFSSASPSIGCVDVKTGKGTMVDVPVQVLKGNTIWDAAEIQFTEGIRNAHGTVVNHRAGAAVRGPLWGGFGHVNPAWPVRRGQFLYWQGGIGVLYRIDLTGDFSPEKLAWTSIDEVGQDWTFGAPAVTDDAVYVRSQLQLVKLRWPEPH